MSSSAADMEDTMSVVGSSQDDEGATVEDSFADFCKTGLGMGENMVNEAVTLFREFKPLILADISATGAGSAEGIERYWTAFILYCLTQLRNGEEKLETEERRLCLPLILRAAKLNPLDFLRETQQLVLKAGHLLTTLYGSDWEKRLEMKEMQMNFTHLKHLYNHYKRAYEEFFLSSDLSNGSQSIDSSNNTPAFLSDYHHLGWLLFLSLRIHVFCGIKDLVTCTNGLVAILAILILHVPVRLRKFSLLNSTRLVRKTDKGLDLLASLCEIYHTSEEDLKAAMEKVNNLIVDVLKMKPLPASECDSENLLNINTDDLLYFEDLFKEEPLRLNMLALDKDYDETIRRVGEFDERNLGNDEYISIAAGNPSASANSAFSTKLNLGLMSSPSKTMTSSLSPPCSPATAAVGMAKVAPTPVSAAMTTAKWLRTIISPLSSKPTMELEHFLSSCDTDITADIIYRANIILDAIFPCCSSGDRSFTGVLQNISLMDAAWAEQRKSEALKLYYRVLEAICRAESQILNGNNLTALLSNERFHRCMLACSAELVLATHKTITMIFPAVLEKTGITAFDLSKVIESFVRHEETLPRELKRHLNSLEERLLESMVWEKGSSMYNSLIVAKPSFSAEITKLALLAEPMPSLDSISVHQKISNGVLTTCPLQKRELPSDCNGDVRSPKRPCTEIRNVLAERNSFDSPSMEHLLGFSSPKAKLPHLQSAFATPTRINPTRGGETCAETGMNIFFGKISKLAAIRIKSLSDKLQLSQQILERVYCLFQQILNQRTSLFFNRHIDQIVLCCFYGVSKVSQLSLTFKEIISRYKKQPHCKTQVFRSVFVDWSVTGHSGKKGQAHLDIITFYNAVFIPLVKPLLMELSAGYALRNNCSSEDGNKADGQVLGSPRSSPFPRLPDMSPKKVSASHNVYVSPLRASKMDSLLSPSSKSYYACVGESTHAYESPSRDLTAINNRLNSGRKMRLNFDIVSDSLVAGSLCPQNGSVVLPSAVGADTVSSIVKCEQPDS